MGGRGAAEVVPWFTWQCVDAVVGASAFGSDAADALGRVMAPGAASVMTADALVLDVLPSGMLASGVLDSDALVCVESEDVSRLGPACIVEIDDVVRLGPPCVVETEGVLELVLADISSVGVPVDTLELGALSVVAGTATFTWRSELTHVVGSDGR